MAGDARTFDDGGDREPRAAATALDLASNGLLARLPAAELERLRPLAERVRPRMRQLLYEQGTPIAHAYFPESGVFSLLAEMSDGRVIETLTVGNEGMLGLSALLGARNSPTRAICQISGWAYRIRVRALLDAMEGSRAFQDLTARYAQARLTSLSRSVGCNRLHSATQRYARWVLTTGDRVGAEEFPITQDFLAQMLGVTRPTVSITGQELQQAGLIHYAHGRLTIDDHARLERVSCECYGTIRDAFDELLGAARR